ncbi:MAG: NAD kinase [Saprospiraceae bacterium]|nr:NAD kinase [Saprospiraceae bacterium]
MKVFIFCQKIKKEDEAHLLALVSSLKNHRAGFAFNRSFLESHDLPEGVDGPVWETYEDILHQRPDYFITLGGDGTILKALTYVRNSGIPLLGINLGRLGFLASTEKKLIVDAVHYLANGMYEIEKRSVLRLDSSHNLFGETPFALNDFTLLKRDNSSMITIHTYINGDYLNSYYADGLIVATPTGSTGYSLSCGGPILFPQARNLIITPVAPHNLNVRPVVIPDDVVLSFEVEGRADNFLCTLDSRYEVITAEHQLAIRREEFDIGLLRLQPTGFLKTLRDKLNWGVDKRN